MYLARFGEASLPPPTTGLSETTNSEPFTARTFRCIHSCPKVRRVTKSANYFRVWCRYRTCVENLIAAANEVDKLFEHHAGFAFVKALEITDDCRANVASMLLRFQIDLSEEIDGVNQGVLAIRIEHRTSLCKPELEMVILLVVVGRPSGWIESEVGGGVLRSESPLKLLDCCTSDRILMMIILMKLGVGKSASFP